MEKVSEKHPYGELLAYRFMIEKGQTKAGREVCRLIGKLRYLKPNPRSEEEKRLQMLRGERLYEESPEKRYKIDRTLMGIE